MSIRGPHRVPGVVKMIDVAGHARLVVALLSGPDMPVLGRGVDAVVGEPRIAETTLGGVPASVARPGRGLGPWPGVLFFPGITARGRMHPGHRGVARGLAAAGFVCAVAEPPGLARGIVAPRTPSDVASAAVAFGRHDAVRPGGFGLAGVSAGATLALLAAGVPEVADEARSVVALAPLCDFRIALRVVSTGTVVRAGRVERFAGGPLIRVVTARSMASCLPAGDDRDALLEHLLMLDDYDPRPFDGLRTWDGTPLSPPARSLVQLLVNEDPDLFDALYDALDPSIRAHVARLSPITHAAAVHCPVELVVPPNDKYVPREDHEAFARACPGARLVVSEALAHVVPRLSRRGLAGMVRLEAASARFLGRVARRYPPSSRPARTSSGSV